MQALGNLGFDNVTVRLSDRRLLNAIASHCGFAEEQKSSVFIALDKLDKVGIDGVLAEVGEIAPDKAQRFVDLLSRVTASEDSFAAVVAELGDGLAKGSRRQRCRYFVRCKQQRNQRQSCV